jgi:hypothetical protein
MRLSKRADLSDLYHFFGSCPTTFFFETCFGMPVFLAAVSIFFLGLLYFCFRAMDTPQIELRAALLPLRESLLLAFATITTGTNERTTDRTMTYMVWVHMMSRWLDWRGDDGIDNL